MDKIEKMNFDGNVSYDKDERILDYIKRVVLKYNPIVEDRVDELLNGRKEFDILLSFYNDEGVKTGRVNFMNGKEYAKTSVLDSLESNTLISWHAVKELIDYILCDHEVIDSFYRTSNSICMSFRVNIKGDTMSGINCGTIGLELSFFGSKDIDMSSCIDYYFKNLVVTYFDKIKDTPFMQREINRYVNGIKEKFLDVSDNEKLLNLLSTLSSEDLEQVIRNMDIYVFMDAIKKVSDVQAEDIKTLGL